MSTIRPAAEPQNPDGPDSEVDLTVQTRPSRAIGSAKTSPAKRDIDTTNRIQPDEDEDLANQSKPSKRRCFSLQKRTITSDEDTTGRDESDEERKSTSSKQTRASLQSIDEDESYDDKRDINKFFQSPVVKTIDGKLKKYCICKLCPGKRSLVNEVTALRSHLEAHHSGKYRKWARNAKYESRLSGDIKKRKAAEEAVDRMLDDLREKKLTEPVVPYTDEAFHQAAIKWLVVTDQPLDALEHPLFKKMIDLAACAVNGV